MTTRPVGSSQAGRARKVGLALVMAGAMSVSVRGQVLAVEPMLGAGMGAVLAITNDLAALLALNEIVSAVGRHVRVWAWAVLLLAGGTGASLNTWHAISVGSLPAGWAALVGAGPVVLAALLSHLVALALTPEQVPESVAHESVAFERSGRVEADAVPHGDKPETLAPTPDRQQGHVRVPPILARGDQLAAGLSEAGPGRVLALYPPPRASRPPRPGRAEAAAGKEDRVQRVLALMTQRPRLSGAAVARELGCSERTGRRLLREAEQRRDGHHQSGADTANSPRNVGLSFYGDHDEGVSGVN